jgi:hypothetical protein
LIDTCSNSFAIAFNPPNHQAWPDDAKTFREGQCTLWSKQNVAAASVRAMLPDRSKAVSMRRGENADGEMRQILAITEVFGAEKLPGYGEFGPGSCVRRYLWLILEPDFELDFFPGTPARRRFGMVKARTTTPMRLSIEASRCHPVVMHPQITSQLRC